MKILEKLNIKPNDIKLYEIAFTHTSYSNEHKEEANYERLEFLGDAVVELIISEYLYQNKALEEGLMTKIRASYVCENALYAYAHNLNFEADIKLGTGETNHSNKTIIADVFEAFAGALYLDQGFTFTKEIILNIIVPFIDNNADFFKDYKSLLQELVQTHQKSVEYEIIKEEGPAHNKSFTCQVKVNDIVLGVGIASSKKAAEQEAARTALDKQAKIPNS